MSSCKVSPPSKTELLAKLDAQECRCVYSGVELTPSTVAIDHYISVKDGGHDGYENLLLVDKRLNSMRGSLGFDEFVRLCCLVVDRYRSGVLEGAVECSLNRQRQAEIQTELFT